MSLEQNDVVSCRNAWAFIDTHLNKVMFYQIDLCVDFQDLKYTTAIEEFKLDIEAYWERTLEYLECFSVSVGNALNRIWNKELREIMLKKRKKNDSGSTVEDPEGTQTQAVMVSKTEDIDTSPLKTLF